MDGETSQKRCLAENKRGTRERPSYRTECKEGRKDYRENLGMGGMCWAEAEARR